MGLEEQFCFRLIGMYVNYQFISYYLNPLSIRWKFTGASSALIKDILYQMENPVEFVYLLTV